MARIRMMRPLIPTMDVRRVKPPPKKADPIYDTPQWRALRKQVFEEAGGICQRRGCGKAGRYVDHIVELRDGGKPFDRAGLELLCPSHHVAKTAAARAARMRRSG